MMALTGWISWRRKTSQRALALLLLVSTLVISFASLFSSGPHTFRAPMPDVDVAPFEIHLDLDLDPDVVPPPRVPPRVNVALFPPAPLGQHTITPDGLLHVNPDGPHPIFQLIADAEKAWSDTLARASTSLEQAVAEYKRRYHRAPPVGFDKWWDYVVAHNVQLPDEYDEIHADMEPFWGIDPAELARARSAVESESEHITVAKTLSEPRLTVVHETLPEHGRRRMLATVENILALVREVETELPPMRLVMSPHDNPGMVSDWGVLSRAREAAANRTPLTSQDLPEHTQLGWIHACPPDSPARLNLSLSALPTQPSVPSHPPLAQQDSTTFIASHRATMDPCAHPSLLLTHGQFLSHKQGPFPRRTLVPRFSLCATLLHHDIRPPVPYGWSAEFDKADEDTGGAFEGDLAWDDKVDERLGWRGRTTGMYASPDTHWVHGHRARLVSLANTLEGNVTLLHVPLDATEAVGAVKQERVGRVNPGWMDVAFTEGPIACDDQGGTCAEMETMWEFRRVQERREEGRYKFILDVDGNGWSGRFKRLMTSNALIFKATIYPEWYMSRIAPWVHYVPVQVNYADLYDAVGFFRVHDALAARIAKAGRDWSRRFWRREDMTAYLYRLLLEYARVTSMNRTSMDYVG